MLNHKVFYNIYAIKEDWMALQDKGGLHTPFQEYEYMQRTWKFFYPYYLTELCIAKFYCFYEDGECVMIVPILHYPGKRRAELFANVNGLNYCDVLVKDEKYIKPALALMAQDYDKLICNKVLSGSLLYSAVKDCLEVDKPSTCVCIDFDSYEDYYSSLPKNMKSNLRNIYNRLKNDGISLELKVFYGGSGFDYKPFIDLYCIRKHRQYNVRNNIFRKWFLLHQNFATRNFVRNGNGITFALFFNGRLAAFISGMKGPHDEYVLPRIAIENDFYRYSPGILLLIETIKYLASESNVRHFDLSHGEEPYKYWIGGKNHLTHNFKINLKKFQNASLVDL